MISNSGETKLYNEDLLDEDEDEEEEALNTVRIGSDTTSNKQGNKTSTQRTKQSPYKKYTGVFADPLNEKLYDADSVVRNMKSQRYDNHTRFLHVNALFPTI